MNSEVVKNFKSEGVDLFDRVKAQLTVKNLVRYLVEGLAIVIAMMIIPQRRTKFNEIAVISAVAALTLFVLDLFSADVAKGARFGVGFQGGLNLVNGNMKLPFV